MRLTWDHHESWFDREYRLVHDGQPVVTFDEIPTLDALRKAEHQHGTRINLWQVGLLCSNCGNDIRGRFAADTESNLLCWDCAMDTHGATQNGVHVNTDPTKAVISESTLHEKGLCDHVINVATGCRHGCNFCYVPTTPAIESREGMLNEQAGVTDAQSEWGHYLLYRDDLPERLHRVLEDRRPEDRKQTERGRGVVMLSSGTDCYQDRRAAQITRGCVQELVANDIPVRILTRNPAVVRDRDLFKEANDLVTVGTSIPSFDTSLVKALEPNAPPPQARWRALDRLQKAGVHVFVSMSPTYPTMDEYQLHNLLGHCTALRADVVFHEPINPRGANFQLCVAAAKECGYDDAVRKLEALRDTDEWVKYALTQINRVQMAAENYDGLRVHSWPDRKLVNAAPREFTDQLRAMREAVPPEPFTGHTISDHPAQSTLVDDETVLEKLL